MRTFLLKRFMELAYTLHIMEIDIDIDEAGLTIEQFEVIDEQLAALLGDVDAEAMMTELIEIVNLLTREETK